MSNTEITQGMGSSDGNEILSGGLTGTTSGGEQGGSGNDILTGGLGSSDLITQGFGAPAGSSESIAVMIGYLLLGTGTDWTGTPFSLVGDAPAVIAYQGVVDSTHAVLTITANGNTGPYTLTDGTNTAELPSLSDDTASGLTIITFGMGGIG